MMVESRTQNECSMYRKLIHNNKHDNLGKNIKTLLVEKRIITTRWESTNQTPSC